ncbi:shikimate dehydrogenase [Pseudohoeflea coraliihabitans]|uniref:Shikimate dehydrogenase (NADP(+)) n=1 Tax=Pseudohoeflea coraliihabitans TaxID=2860393 RepID=A0ABS6WVL5_9HYPH|nr:shikimate dehydrogenase [Pseudohoeflea sp. DP4N28-3]MBW3099135.1 shikimate dehydrogenase [Pseudohoeflea sp. DP4N28-3]
MDRLQPRAFVIGDPIAHSRSPLIHRHWLKEFKIEGTYQPIAVSAEKLPGFIAEIKSGKAGFVGGNITIPHKEAVLHLADHSDDITRAIGSGNTLWMEDGRLCATNTDAYGFCANLDAEATGWDRGRKAVVLGAGGASRAVLHALEQRGFAQIILVNRTLERAASLAPQFKGVEPAPMEALQSALRGADLFVNTSSLGMGGGTVPDLDFSVMTPEGLVTDIVYVPLRTPFLDQAERQGRPTVDGLGMLLHQAVPGFEKWFGRRPEVTPALRQTILADLAQ